MSKYCFGIDVGGTSVKCGLFQTDGTLADKWEIPTRTENQGENILPDVASRKRTLPAWVLVSPDRSIRKARLHAR